jgi:hypothetical protein
MQQAPALLRGPAWHVRLRVGCVCNSSDAGRRGGEKEGRGLACAQHSNQCMQVCFSSSSACSTSRCLSSFSSPCFLQGSGLCSDVTPPALALLFILVSTMHPPPWRACAHTWTLCVCSPDPSHSVAPLTPFKVQTRPNITSPVT